MSPTNVATPRNILVFADGTANEGGLLPDENRTNVYKLFRVTRVTPETSIDPTQQIAFYVSGIGTPSPGKPPTWHQWIQEGIDQMFGVGLGHKIVECYLAIISVWRPGDHIYLFGFSRGADTVRCLAHVLEVAGIPTAQPDGSSLSLDPKHLVPIAEEAVKILFRFGEEKEDDAARDAKAAKFRGRYKCAVSPNATVVPYFVGVWDSVAAEGWSRFFPGHDDRHFPSAIKFARHAMAIDEYRKDFARVSWGGSGTVRPGVEGEPLPFKQVWFAGCHADIGGGYPENESRLSDISLAWMRDFITKELPVERRIAIDERYLNLHPSPEGMMHDECMAGKIPWDKKVRLVDPAGELHSTVLDRLRLKEVRNFQTYGAYRPANLVEHPAAQEFFAPPPTATS